MLQVALPLMFFAFLLLKVTVQKRQGLRSVVLRNWKERGMVALLFAWNATVVLDGLGLADFLSRPRWFESETLEVLGMACAIAGLLLFGAALLHLGRSWRIGIDEASRDQLVTTGVFAWSRHPIYVFMDLFAWGLFLMQPSPFYLLSALAISIGAHLRMLEEDRYLARVHGQAWTTYRDRSARYFGRRRPKRGQHPRHD